MDADTFVTSNGRGIDFVTPREGQNIRISCTSTGAPLPSIRWARNSQNITLLATTDTFTDYVITLTNVTESQNLLAYQEATVSPGRTVSTLDIENFQSEDEGIYECIGSNTGKTITAYSSAMIYVFFEGKFLHRYKEDALLIIVRH